MFTALVTFLVTVTMILGGAGSPVDVILDSLSTDLVYTWEVLPEEGEDPIEEPVEDPVEEEKGNGPEARIGQQDDFQPVGAPDPAPSPDPSPFWEEDAEDDWPDPSPDPMPKQEFGKGLYGGDNAAPPEEPEEADAVDDEPVDVEEKGNRPPEAGTGKPDEIAPDPQPDPNPEPEPGPEPAPDPNNEEVDPQPAPNPQPEPDPDPEPVLGEGPGEPNEPNPEPAPDCEEDSCPAPEPSPEQPATGGGEGGESKKP